MALAGPGSCSASCSAFRFAPARLRFGARHPFFEEGDVRRHLSLQGLLLTGLDAEEEEEEEAPPEPPGSGREFLCPAGGCCQALGSLEGLEHHYNLLHREVCSCCRRAFPSAHLLDLHLLEWHDSLFQLMAQKHDMYQCLVESCTEKFKSSQARKTHLVKVHRYPPDFRFDKPLQSKSTRQPKPLSRESAVPMEVAAEEAERQSQGDAMEVGPSQSTAEEEEEEEGAACLLPGPESTPALPVAEKRLYRSRIPPTICFGQGATRGFKGRKKKA
ncbi:zinc finger protein 511 isoform X2 [Hemicordylus capensis]|uniref:zinc finger protein 511 isoform X2 n=1 Tax=Hemicordylus capensis TaxID=884348 RepID=UPI0023020266|nr:zinc finger protein 511 isoform X2 [Hemicordylus capensis]